MMRSLRLGLTSPIHQWGFSWDGMWQRTVWHPSRTFWRRTRGSRVVWRWPTSCLMMWAHVIGSALLLCWPDWNKTRLLDPPRGVARQGLGHPLRLTRLLGRDLVARSALLGCLARFGRLLRLVRLLGRDFVAHSNSRGCSIEIWLVGCSLRGFLGLYLGTPFLGTR